ncbi:hypothetical protein EXIGLDRAFT_85916 [Exidia glandulosa HHB12029]|uniref:Protein kinase domain-containing protein n=1 Tax=Exidia glandulosa HHB12029 TaxID=1314781 RepID=A0A165HE88_EXIGL|nr:hypothetical protein EXIGLDRAFT_85916 [Exidia glandulosa HHB12029]
MSFDLAFVVLDPLLGFLSQDSFPLDGDSTVDNLKQQVRKRFKVEEVDVSMLDDERDIIETSEDMRQLSWIVIVSRAALLPSSAKLAPIAATQKNERIWLVVVAGGEDKAATLRTSYQAAAVAATRSKHDPPSHTAVESKLVDEQLLENADAILNGRPQALTGPPVGVYHPVFTAFQRRCSSSDDLSSDDVRSTAHFLAASCRYYQHENTRKNAIGGSLADLMHGLKPSGIFSPCEILDSGGCILEPDVHVTVTSCLLPKRGPAPQIMCALLGEIRNGISSPLEHATHGYRTLCATPELDDVRRGTSMPMFLLSISGPQLVIAGVVFVDRVVVGRLTDTISLVPVQQYEHLRAGTSSFDAVVDRVGKLLRALRESVLELQRWYASTEDMKIAWRMPGTDPHPHLTKVGKYSLIYQARIACDIPSRAIWFASISATGMVDRRCIVKFAPRYDGETHRLLYANEAAPLLYYCDWSDSVGQMVAVYEYVERLEREPEPEEIDKLRLAVAALHKAGRVHGDLRFPNILVTKGKLMIIDYDWAGLEGEVTYPADINLSEECGWHSEVRSFGNIMAQHDDWLVDKLADASPSSFVHSYM